MDTILLFKKDLGSYSTKSLRVMQRYLGLPAAGREDLLWTIAIHQAESNTRGTMPTTDERKQLMEWAQANNAERQIEMVLDGGKKLYLDGKGLRDIPVEIGKLDHLQWLYLQDNQLTKLPKELRDLHELVGLNVSRNQLKELPIELGGLYNLNKLIVHDNPLAEGTPSTIQELRDLAQLRVKSAKKRMHSGKEELPYAGDILAAMRAQDRAAIRVIQEWRQSQQAERSKQAVQEAEEKQIPTEAADCENPIDLITQEEWDADNLPGVKITLWDIADPINGPKRTVCFNREKLEQWVNNPDHKMATWIPNNLLDGVINNEGKWGGPSKIILTQLPDRTLIIGDITQFDEKSIGIPMATNLRVGNRAGVFGVSNLHGQLPGETVYVISSEDDTDYEGYIQAFVNNLHARKEIWNKIRILHTVFHDIYKSRFNELQHEIVADNILDGDVFTQEFLVEFSENEEFKNLINVPGFSGLIQDFKVLAKSQLSGDASAAILREIFLKILQHMDSGEASEEIGYAYEEFLLNFYSSPDKMFEELIDRAIPDFSLGEIIQMSIKLWKEFPEEDDDYEEGKRVGPGIAYESDDNGEEYETDSDEFDSESSYDDDDYDAYIESAYQVEE